MWADSDYSEWYDIVFTKDPAKCAGVPAPTTAAAPPAGATQRLTPVAICPPCRKVLGYGPRSGVYTHTKSGDDRCTYDGCLYTKDSEDYCFDSGSDTVEDTCEADAPIL